MALRYEPESEPEYTNLVRTPRRSRVENLVAWEEPGDAVSKCVICHVRCPHKHPQKWMVLASKMLAPNTMTLQIHREKPMVFEKSHFVDNWVWLSNMSPNRRLFTLTWWDPPDALGSKIWSPGRNLGMP